MTKNIKILNSFGKRTCLKPLSYVCVVCSIALLSSCSGAPSPRIPAMKKEQTPEAEVKNSVSHMASEISSTPKTVARSTLNPKNMFGKDLRSNEERLDRLERAVQDMRHEFDMVTPSIRRLMAVEGDIQELIIELKKLSDDPSIATPAPRTMTNEKSRPVTTPQVITTPQALHPTSAPKKAAVTPNNINRKAPPPVQGGKASVYDVRVGEHPGKTRIVLDVNAKTSFSTDIDNGEKIMIVELPNAGWSTTTSKSFDKSSYLTSYKVESSGDGQLLIFQLKREARIAYKEDIGGANGGRRIVIDLAGS